MKGFSKIDTVGPPSDTVETTVLYLIINFKMIIFLNQGLQEYIAAAVYAGILDLQTLCHVSGGHSKEHTVIWHNNN